MYDILSYSGEFPDFKELSYTYVNNYQINDSYLYSDDVIDNEDLYESTIDDIIENLPKTINEKYDLNIIYDRILNKWKVGYYFNSEFLHIIFDYDLHNALIKLNNEIENEENK